MFWAAFQSQKVWVYPQALIQSAPLKLPNSAKLRKIKAIMPFKVIQFQGRRFWYSSKAHIDFLWW